VPLTLQLLAAWPIAYGDVFNGLVDSIAAAGLPHEPEALAPFPGAPPPPRKAWLAWRDAWWAWSHHLPPERRAGVAATLRRWTLPEPPVRSRIERIWDAIDQRDDWEPLRDWLERCGSSHSAESGCSALQPPQPGSV
jgi:hypothetical protein